MSSLLHEIAYLALVYLTGITTYKFAKATSYAVLLGLQDAGRMLRFRTCDPFHTDYECLANRETISELRRAIWHDEPIKF